MDNDTDTIFLFRYYDKGNGEILLTLQEGPRALLHQFHLEVSILQLKLLVNGQTEPPQRCVSGQN